MKHSHNFVDQTGKRFGRLTVISLAGKNLHGQTKWLLKCDCGKEITKPSFYFVNGHTTSCGCYHKEVVNRPRTHGYCRDGKTVEYKTWVGIKKRCYNQNNKDYHHYGGRGIVMCPRWLESFENFLADMGLRPHSKLSIERVDNEKGYEPGNCIWATQKVQRRNSRNVKKHTFNGETLTATEWAIRLGVKKWTMYARLRNKNFSIERALSEKVICRK